ncbi:MAG: hypothetical protein EVA87_03040 [Rhodospirillaceae bacterium]|nr:MAG: hypothetical protein EVA87_03040 [Rhodospirillaceae bacterium]
MRYLGSRPAPTYDGVAQPDADGPPAVVALFLRSLLPIVWNTQAGLHGIDPTIIVSARDMVLAEGVRLVQVELPLATRSIMAGAKTSAVLNSEPPRWAP